MIDTTKLSSRASEVTALLGDIDFGDPSHVCAVVAGAHSRWNRFMTRGGGLALWRSGAQGSEPAAAFFYEKRGMFNTRGAAVLALKAGALAFEREKDRGVWRAGGAELGTVEIDRKMRVFSAGTAVVRLGGREIARIVTPSIGPTSARAKDCRGTVAVGGTSFPYVILPALGDARASSVAAAARAMFKFSTDLFTAEPPPGLSPVLPAPTAEAIARAAGRDGLRLLFAVAVWTRTLYPQA